ncbi:MAG: ShlB/FhaC/HecB family hemolysin secretion/activation protein [Brachymonas sp.]
MANDNYSNQHNQRVQGRTSVQAKRLQDHPLRPLAKALMWATLAAGLAFAATQVKAQTPPTAGQVQRDVGAQAPALPKAEPVLPKAQEVRPQLRPANNFSMQLNGIRFSGNTQIMETDLQLLIVESLGERVGFNELQAAADAVSNFYRGKGFFVARAYLPQQEIKDGIVEIAVLEGRVGQAAVKQDGTVRTAAAVAQGYVEANVPVGSIVNEKALERAALLANDLPGIDASISLDPGAQVGDTNVTLTTNEGRLFQATVDLDNHGNQLTGQYRLGTTLNFNSPFGIGDHLSLRLMHSNGDLALMRTAYQVPVGNQGLRIGGSFSRVVFTVKPTAGLSPSGESNNISLFAMYPLERQRDRSIYLNANFDNKQMKNRSGAATIGQRELNVLTLGASLQSRDSMGGGGVNFANVSLATGVLNIKDALGVAANQAGAKAEGHFTKLGLQGSRIQRLSSKFSFYAGMNAQYTINNLDSAEKFSLGGAQGVRGYAPGEATGDMGYVTQFELRADLPIEGATQWQTVLFFDHGAMRQDHTRYAGSALGSAFAYSLDSAGVGLNVSRSGAFQIRAIWAKALGNNNGATAPSFTNVDGTKKRDRFWLQAVTQF